MLKKVWSYPVDFVLGSELYLIGRAKRAPCWGVQSRFRVIDVVGMSYVVCLSYVKLTA